MKTYLKAILTLLLFVVISCDPNDTIEPIPPSDGAIIEPNVGGPDQPNQVFIDLSSATTTTVPRTTWDLGFYNGDEFKVILNYSAYMVARPTDQTDLTQVSSNLVTEDYKAITVVAPEGNIEWIDNQNGDLNETAISTISLNENENVVYVINRGQIENNGVLDELGFLKLKITRDGQNYNVTYGDIDAMNFSSATIAKNANYNFTFFNFDDGIVNVEPEKNLWDIALTTTSTHYFDYSTNTTVPYKFKDFVISNYGSIKISSVDVTDMMSYEGFTMDDVGSLTLEDNRLGIGSSWRKFDGATFSFTINPDIFYIIEDVDGNYYKLMFTRMYCITGDCAGERGYPEFTYELLK